MVVNNNVIDLTITPGAEGAAPERSVSPQTAYFRINNQLKTGAWLRCRSSMYASLMERAC
jgi:hypothetical protein